MEFLMKHMEDYSEFQTPTNGQEEKEARFDYIGFFDGLFE